MNVSQTSYSRPTAIDLPACVDLELHSSAAIAVRTIGAGVLIRAASLRLRLPVGFTETVRLPYVLTNGAGDGRVA